MGRLYSNFLKSGAFYSVVTNAPFMCRVKKGVETSGHITEFGVVRILGFSIQGAKNPRWRWVP